MRKIILLFLALPLLGVAQNKTLISASRYFPKEGKANLFEKALAVHAQKYHKGDQKWRVSTIETGPDAGGYLVIEGPTNWEGIDKRGDLVLFIPKIGKQPYKHIYLKEPQQCT